MTTDTAKILDILKQINSVPSVVGYEYSFFTWLYKRCKEYSTDISLMRGYVSIEIGEGGPIYSAHADRHGMVKVGNDEYRYAANHLSALQNNTRYEQNKSSLMRACERMLAQPVTAYDAFTGKILGEGIVEASNFCEDDTDLTFHIPGLDRVPIGTPIGYSTQYNEHDGIVEAQLDNTLSIAIMLYAISQKISGTYLFTAEEEIGNSWIWISHYLHSHNISGKKLFILDTSPYPEESIHKQDAHIILRHKDAYTSFDKDLSSSLGEEATALHIPFVYKDDFVDEYNAQGHAEGYGRTELGAFLTKSNDSISATTIQIPTKGYHTAQESTLIQNIPYMYSLIQKISSSN